MGNKDKKRVCEKIIRGGYKIDKFMLKGIWVTSITPAHTLMGWAETRKVSLREATELKKSWCWNDRMASHRCKV